jgi:hypothetical protein
MTTPAGNTGLQIVKGMARYGVHVLREQFTDTRATGLTDIPVSRTEVTCEWLTAILCAEHPGTAIESFTAEDATKGTSNRWRATVAYNAAGREAGLPTELFAKTSLSWSQRMLLGLVDILEGEPGFYQHFRPHLEIEAPYGYHGAADVASGRSIALTEDVTATKKVTFCTPQTPISRAEIEDLLCGMAVLHGKHWNDPQLEKHTWLRPPSVFIGKLAIFAGLKKRGVVGIKRAASVLPQGIVSMHEDLYQALVRSSELADQGPFTLLHGDSHISNVYRTASGRMGFTDWQVVMRGSWAHDVAYLVSTSLGVEDRRDWECDLLVFYLEQLAAAGGDAPDFDTAWLAYRQQLLYPYFAWLLAIGRSTIQPKFQPDSTSLAIIERTATAVVDLDSLGAINDSR